MIPDLLEHEDGGYRPFNHELLADNRNSEGVTHAQNLVPPACASVYFLIPNLRGTEGFFTPRASTMSQFPRMELVMGTSCVLMSKRGNCGQRQQYGCTA